MLRKFLRKLGVFKALIVLTIGSTSGSVLIYLILSSILDGISFYGIIESIIIPIIIAPLVSFFFIKYLIELEHTEESLRISEARYRSIVEAAPIIVAIIRSRDARYLEVNKVFCEFTGYTREEVLGKTPVDLNLFVNPEDQQRFAQKLKKERSVSNFEVQYRMRDGTTQDTLTSARPLRYKEENCLITISMTITERKQAEKALRESEERYRLLAENVTDVIWIRDLNLKIKYLSPSAKNMTGFSVEELMEDDFRSFFTPTSVKLAKEVLAEEIAAEERGGKNPLRTRTLELKGHRKDGSKVWTEEKVSFLRTLEGKPIGILGVSRDVTERKEAALALQQSEERYRSLVENTMDGYFICDVPSGRLLFFNQRCSDLYGYTMQEGLRLALWDVVCPEEHVRMKKRIQAHLGRKDLGNERQIYNSLRKDGSTFRSEISTSLVTYRGKPAIQGVVRDVSEQERLQQQLQRAQRMEAIGTLAGGIAHDFNNLLMAIEGNISLLLIDKHINEAQRERIAKIERYILDARKVTEQLLGFAMGGKYEIRPLDLNETIDKTCEMFGRTKKEIKIQTKYQEGIWAVEADRGQIEQVLLNLYVNAWQAMPGGGNLYLQTENISLSREDATRFGIKQGSYVKISIADTGIGMDKDTQARIFDPFFTTKEIGRGTGLGLASAYGIIKNHGGIINVYSEIGQGTALHIYLPASEVPVLKEGDTRQDISRGVGTILVVDDEEMILDVAEGILKSLGYTVLLASGGREAIEIYQQKGAGIELVVLDIIMPGMSGGETYDRLKEIDPEVKALLSSGYSMDGKAKEILNRGCNGFIQKPFNVRDLSIKLKEIIKGKK